MIPTIEKVKDMKNRYPALENYIIKLEERYKQLCLIIDSSSVSNDVKNRRKNTYYIFLMIVKKLISNSNYKCLLLVKDDSVVIDSKTIKLPFNDELLFILLENDELLDIKYYADHAVICNLSLNHEKVRERTIEN